MRHSGSPSAKRRALNPCSRSSAAICVAICPGAPFSIVAPAVCSGREMETIVVDDGSTDDTSAVGHRHGARVIRHPANRGLSAARNSGVLAAGAPVVAFLDDDCVPEPSWARKLLAAHGDGVIGVGGPVSPASGGGFV